MKKGLWNKRMPTLMAFIILFASVWVTTFLIQKGVILVGRATPSAAPENVTISNVTDTSFTVSFTTPAKAVAGISVEGVGAPFVVYDDRNRTASNQTPFFSHYITVADLSPKTTYLFSVISEGETYLNNGQKYSVITGGKIDGQPLTQLPITGNVLLPQGGPADDTLITLSVKNGQVITGVTKGDGQFIIPTNAIRTSDFAQYLAIDPDDEVTLKFNRGEATGSVRALFKNSASIPPVTLLQDYDFTGEVVVTQTPSSSVLKAPAPQVEVGEVRILTPAASQSFVDNQPLFRGTAIPNQTVKITIESNPIQTQVTAGTNGVWTYRPDSPLPPGQHTITIQTLDKYGIIKTLSQTFVVFASGSQIAQTATPSATPIVNTPTPTPTQVPTTAPQSTPTPTAIPSQQITNTPTPTVAVATDTPTPTPTVAIPTSIPTNVPRATPAPTGTNSSIILTGVSLLLIVSGSILLFLL